MRNRLKTLLQFTIYWTVFFIVGKALFIAFNSSKTEELTFSSSLLSLIYGLKLDLSFVGYLLVVPFLLLIIDSIYSSRIGQLIFRAYSYLLINVFLLLILIDAILYQHWGMKLDVEPFKYLNNPSLVVGNLSVSILIMQVLLYLFLVTASIWLFNEAVKFPNRSFSFDIKSSFILFILGGNLIWPIRGGFDIKPKLQLGIPIQVSTVFFHSDIFYNHAAYNVPWYIGQSLVHLGKKNSNLNICDHEVARVKFKEIVKANFKTDSTKLLRVQQPNIILIVLESFTANIIEPLGGKKGVSPNFTHLAKQGVLFTNCYATGTHSDKGMGAIYSGAPALPKTSVVEVPSKMNALHYFTQNLRDNGYSTQMTYGGDLNFGNFNLLFSQAGIAKTIGKKDFPDSQMLSKWGIPDEFTLEFLYNEAEKAKQPFFQALFTLSSHAPFDTPMETVFQINNEDDKFYNSVYYTDQELGEFVAKMKLSPIWENTLIILIADHGVDYGSKKPRHHPSKFKIPMLWLGGALAKQGIEISQTCSQTDLSTTLLNQLHITHDPNEYSKDILQSNGYAFYSYNNGFAFITDSSATCYDLNAKQFVLYDNPVDSLMGTYYMQYWADNFNDLDKME